MSTETVPATWEAFGALDASTRAAMILLPAIHGANDYCRGVAKELAQAGFPTLLIDIYAPGQVPDLSTPTAIRAAVADLDDTRVLDQVRAAVAHIDAATVGNAKVGALGFCIGGTHALLAASEVPGISAAVGYYGMLRYPEKTARKPMAPMDRAAGVRAPVLYHVGDNDAWVDAATLQEYAAKLREHAVVHEIGIYRGAGHAFHEHHRPVYRPVAAQASWQKTLVFLDWYLKDQRSAVKHPRET